MLLQLHQDLATRKVLLVGHSQGAVYANKIYEYLTNHGMPKENVAVYAVATPDNYVAGGGKYITYTLDDVIRNVAPIFGRLNPLPANVDFVDFLNSPDFSTDIPAQGHGFIQTYLGGFGTRMKADMTSELASLKSLPVTAADGCFEPPHDGPAHQVASTVLSVGDFYMGAFGDAMVKNYQYATAGIKALASVAGSLQNGFSGLASGSGKSASSDTKLDKTGFAFTKAVFGSGLDFQTFDELHGSLGGAVVLAFAPKSDTEPSEWTPPVNPPQQLVPFPDVPVAPGFGGGGGAAAAPVASIAAPVVLPDGVPPQLLSVETNQYTLQLTYASVLDAPLATTSTNWSVRITFNEPMSVPPTITDGAPNASPSATQTVNDCGDSDAATFCFMYMPSVEANGPDWWQFNISGGVDVSGEAMAPVIYPFRIDTYAPRVVPSTSYVNSSLPSVGGTIDTPNADVSVLVNGYFFSTAAPVNAWSVTLQSGQELLDGMYDVYASSTDRQGNTGPVAHWQIVVDTVPPTATFTPDILSGSMSASTAPFVAFSAGDNNPGVSFSCIADGTFSSACTGWDISSVVPGTHTVSVTARDAAGNQTTETRTFDVLP